MSSSLLVVILSLSILGVSEGMNVENKEEFASGLLHVLDMEHAPNISGRRHAIPRYVYNLYRRKFSRTSLNRGRITWIFFPEGLDETASSVSLRFNLSSCGHQRTHRVHKAELHLQVYPLDGGERQVSIVQISQLFQTEDLKAEYNTTIAIQVCHKLIKSRWLVFDLTEAMFSEVNEGNGHLRLFISSNPTIKIAVNGKRQPFITVVSKQIDTQGEKQSFPPMISRQYSNLSNYHVTNIVTDTSTKEPSNQRSKRSDVNICRKRRHTVRFRDLKWNGWIIAPTRFGFHYCQGDCPGTLSQECNPSNHAILQNILHHRLSRKIPAATCVPTELHSMSLLYYDTDNTIVLREVPGMVASNCGCR
ncbi:protein dbl-1-like [Montipora capricornis]|uniref:protein dbl-1-like n=1 Tax=Montipora capricornis TaxID=246305 RepID=UPI0035F1E3CC